MMEEIAFSDSPLQYLKPTLRSFFFQAAAGIRAWSVTGVQTCALPICGRRPGSLAEGVFHEAGDLLALVAVDERSYLDALLGAASDLHGLHTIGELLGELTSDAVGDVEA